MLNRRQFVSRASLLLAALTLSCDTGSSFEPLHDSLTISLSDFPTLMTVGNAVRVDGTSKTPVALVRSGDATFEAFSLKCPHQGGLLEVDAAKKTMACSNHGATFNLDGQWIGGQKTGNLRAYETHYDEVDGTVTILPR